MDLKQKVPNYFRKFSQVNLSRGAWVANETNLLLDPSGRNLLGNSITSGKTNQCWQKSTPKLLCGLSLQAGESVIQNHQWCFQDSTPSNTGVSGNASRWVYQQLVALCLYLPRSLRDFSGPACTAPTVCYQRHWKKRRRAKRSLSRVDLHS